ncbi:hypothetical protein [Cytobacillus firmus]|uniref:hypothetical protein n=1 Tax=Cytobacillus firmus TaxID=1399 RepID=UPI0018CFA034|nr:hypothetical protein [Cytobacillus firmus]MBG9550018.1 hypothetical protein [Cytobacillus firmus]MBG9604010.1 hypothetical protein [Cytobacillus firmus]MED1940803.1 hypothetical protein [Cytobacillus firmus]
MNDFNNIPKTYLNQLAKANKVVFSGRESEEVIKGLLEKSQLNNLIYLNEQFKYSSTHMTLCKPESHFPDKSKTPELFLSTLVKEKHITKGNINKEWEPILGPGIKICAIRHDGASVYLKFVEEKFYKKKKGYGSIIDSYASFTSVVIHFGEEEIIQVRCPVSEVNKYSEHVMHLMGFAKPYDFFTVPKLTRENAIELCKILSAGVASRHIAIPSNVGSLRFNGKRGINIANDQTYHKLTQAIQGIGIPTDQTMDETCFFTYTDDKTNVKVEARFEVNIQGGFFKFTKTVPEFVFDHVLEALVRVNNGAIDNQEIAASTEASN